MVIIRIIAIPVGSWRGGSCRGSRADACRIRGGGRAAPLPPCAPPGHRRRHDHQQQQNPQYHQNCHYYYNYNQYLFSFLCSGSIKVGAGVPTTKPTPNDLARIFIPYVFHIDIVFRAAAPTSASAQSIVS